MAVPDRTAQTSPSQRLPRAVAALLALATGAYAAAQNEDHPPAAVEATFKKLHTAVDASFKRRTLADALAELTKQTQVPITLSGDAAKQEGHLVTWRGRCSLLEALEALGGRSGLQPVVGNDGAVKLLLDPKAPPAPPEWVTDARPVRTNLPNSSRRSPPPNGWNDPVEALGADDEAAIAKGKFVAKAFIDGYVDRLEAWHVAHSEPPAELIAFLKAHPDIRRDLWRAISPQYDDARSALRVFEALRTASEKRVIENKHLAIALSVVFDSPDAPASSRFCYLWDVSSEQFAPAMDAQEVFDYFTDPRNQATFVFKPKELAWPLMVHLVDFDLGKPEIEWAKTTYAKKIDLQALYSQVPYDYDKLNHHPRLGDRPYLLENLKKYGGVCVDQAHYASRIAKAFGVPAVKCGGQGRYGGAGHSWSGYLAVDPKTHAPVLEFTGRYLFDFYYTGTIFDPQTRCETLDRNVALMYEGVSGGKYDDYIDGSTLARAAAAIETVKPAVAVVLAKEAAKRDAYVADAWRVLMRLARGGALPEKEADQAYHKLLATLGTRHPDICLEALTIYLDAIPESKGDARQKLYQESYAAFGAAKRPDLQIRMRLDQLDELSAAGKSKQVIALAFETVSANIKEGTLVMPLVKQVVELSKHFAATDKSFQLKVVKDALTKLSADFPKQRGNTLSPAWEEYETLMDGL
jgi:hypothetical protein